MKLTNGQIYTYCEKLTEAFHNEKKYFPAKINFLIQKNLSYLTKLYEEINNARLNIIYKYGESTEDDQMIIPADKIESANNELKDLLNITQEVDIYLLDIKEIEDIEFTSQQMNALLFMITDTDDEEII